MQIYLPIAEVSVDVFFLLALGASVGVISGLFGVGGGFLMTPLLIFAGIPSAVAVSTQAPQLVASSFSGVLAHWKRRAVDVKMALILLGGGLVGSEIGVAIFAWLRTLGQVEFAVTMLYVVFLGIVGVLMAVESVAALRSARKSAQGEPPAKPRSPRRRLIHRLPFKTRFRASQLYMSVIPPILMGLFIGVLGAIMGVGGGFIMLPAMIYILGMPTKVVVGTSLLQIMGVMAYTTWRHSVENQTVDAVLALLLLLGGVVGAQIGAVIGERLRGEQLRFLLAALVLSVGFVLALSLVIEPSELYSIHDVESVGATTREGEG